MNTIGYVGLGAALSQVFLTVLLLSAVSTLVPGAFWLFCSSMFDDHYDFPAWQPILVALSVIMPGLTDPD